MEIISNNMIRWMNATVTLNHFIHCNCRAGNVLCKLCNWLQLQCLLMAQIFSTFSVSLSISCSSNSNYLNSVRWNGLRDFIKIIVSFNSIHCSHVILIICTRLFFCLYLSISFFIFINEFWMEIHERKE